MNDSTLPLLLIGVIVTAAVVELGRSIVSDWVETYTRARLRKFLRDGAVSYQRR